MISNLVTKRAEGVLVHGDVLKIPGGKNFPGDPRGSHASKFSQPWLHVKITWEIEKKKKKYPGLGPTSRHSESFGLRYSPD